MKEWLYILRPLREAMLTEGPSPGELQVLSAHGAHLQQLLEQGSLVLAGRTQYDDMRTMGLVVLRAADEESARSLMESDPPVAAGVMSAELHPYHVAFLGRPLE
ncbi:MAG: YciI family protein [bacterium]